MFIRSKIAKNVNFVRLSGKITTSTPLYLVNDFKVATLHEWFLIAIGIIMQRLKSIGICEMFNFTKRVNRSGHTDGPTIIIKKLRFLKQFKCLNLQEIRFVPTDVLKDDKS